MDPMPRIEITCGQRVKRLVLDLVLLGAKGDNDSTSRVLCSKASTTTLSLSLSLSLFIPLSSPTLFLFLEDDAQFQWKDVVH
jgi:hypothetical protein